MLAREAEERFREGMQLLARGHAREALPFFNEAVREQRRVEDPRGQGRYLSYYGLCLCLSRGSQREALRSCRLAAKFEEFSPEIWWNLGRVALALGRKAEAYRSLNHGLELDPTHEGIRGDLNRMGMRRPQVLPFLSRQNPLNVILGRMR